MVNTQHRLLVEFVRWVLTEAVISGLIPWPHDVKQIPEQSEADIRSHIGPFERRLAKILNGTLTGRAASWDIEAAGKKFEVKKPDGNEIRLGGESLESFSKSRGRIERVCRQIDSVFGESSKKITRAAAKKAMSPEQFERVTKFANDDVSAIMKGNYSAGRMHELGEVINIISRTIISNDQVPETDQKYFVLGDKEHKIEKNVDIPTYVKIGKAANISTDELGVTPSDVLASTFNLYAFRNPENFMKENWTQALMPANLFSDVSAVILASTVGYRIIPRNQLNNVLAFYRIAGGRVILKVVA